MTLRVRALDNNGDYQLGRGSIEFLVDNSAAVAQKILTRLKLFSGTWFLDTSAGTPWLQQILGRHASSPPPAPGLIGLNLYDIALKTVILNTKGVSQLVSYSSTLDSTTRALRVSAEVQTIFSTTPITINQSVPLNQPFVLGSTPLG